MERVERGIDLIIVTKGPGKKKDHNEIPTT